MKEKDYDYDIVPLVPLRSFNQEKYKKTLDQIRKRQKIMEEKEKNNTIKYLIRKLKHLDKENLILEERDATRETIITKQSGEIQSLQGLVITLTKKNDELMVKKE